MIIGQLALCEECRDGSCPTCKAFVRRQQAKKRAAERMAREVVEKAVRR